MTAVLAPYLRYPQKVPSADRHGWQGRHHLDGIQHEPIRYVQPSPPTDYLKAMFVRNPFDVVVSVWPIDEMPFDKFVSEEIESRQHPLSRDTMLESIIDVEGNILSDFIGRYENLEIDWNKFCWLVGLPKLKLPHKNVKKSRKNDDYRTHYSAYSYRVVEEVFGNDLKYFGYSLDK